MSTYSAWAGCCCRPWYTEPAICRHPRRRSPFPWRKPGSRSLRAGPVEKFSWPAARAWCRPAARAWCAGRKSHGPARRRRGQSWASRVALGANSTNYRPRLICHELQFNPTPQWMFQLSYWHLNIKDGARGLLFFMGSQAQRVYSG